MSQSADSAPGHLELAAVDVDEEVIRSYLDNPRYRHRPWLEQAVIAAANAARIVLITGSPGMGKSGLMAAIADAHKTWPRLFLRRDQVRRLHGGGVRNVLVLLGLQLARFHPECFDHEAIKVSVSQRARQAGAESEIVGVEVDRVIATPFYRAAVSVSQEVGELRGRLIGLRAAEWITDIRMMPVRDLQEVALFNPCRYLEASSADPVLLLIDALDEEVVVGAEESGLADWLQNLPHLPATLRIIITSRPELGGLDLIRERQKHQLHEISLAWDNPQLQQNLQSDVSDYAAALYRAAIQRLPEAQSVMTEDAFVQQATQKAAGNIGYLDALARAIDRDPEFGSASPERSLRLMRLESLPANLQELYAFFLRTMRERVGDSNVLVESPSGAVPVSAWGALYSPLLAFLAVAHEPVSVTTMLTFGTMAGSASDIGQALRLLAPFLSQIGDLQKLYHRSLQDFLADNAARKTFAVADLLPAASEAHARLVAKAKALVGGWATADWSALEPYGQRYLLAHAAGLGGGDSSRQIREICEGGFPRYKSEHGANLPEVESDWSIAFAVARKFDDFVGFCAEARLHTAQLSKDLELLPFPIVVAARAQLSHAAGNTQALGVLPDLLALIRDPGARLKAAAMIFRLLAPLHWPDPALARLQSDIDAMLVVVTDSSTLDDSYPLYLLGLLGVRAPNLPQAAQDALKRMIAPDARASVWCHLAQHYLVSANMADATKALRQAIAEALRLIDQADRVAELVKLVLHKPSSDRPERAEASLRQVVATARRLDAESWSTIRPELSELHLDSVQRDWNLRLHITYERGRRGEAGTTDAVEQLARGVLEGNTSDYQVAATSLGDSSEEKQRAQLELALPSCVALFPLLRYATQETRSRFEEATLRAIVQPSMPGFSVYKAAKVLSIVSPADDPSGSLGVVARALQALLRNLGGELELAMAANLTLWAAHNPSANGGIDTAAELTGQLDRLRSFTPPEAKYPEQLEMRRQALWALWQASMLILDGGALGGACDCIVEASWKLLGRQHAVAFIQNLMEIWPDARDLATAVRVVAGLYAALVAAVDRSEYITVASAQFAEAYALAGDTEASARHMNGILQTQQWTNIIPASFAHIRRLAPVLAAMQRSDVVFAWLAKLMKRPSSAQLEPILQTVAHAGQHALAVRPWDEDQANRVLQRSLQLLRSVPTVAGRAYHLTGLMKVAVGGNLPFDESLTEIYWKFLRSGDPDRFLSAIVGAAALAAPQRGEMPVPEAELTERQHALRHIGMSLLNQVVSDVGKLDRYGADRAMVTKALAMIAMLRSRSKLPIDLSGADHWVLEMSSRARSIDSPETAQIACGLCRYWGACGHAANFLDTFRSVIAFLMRQGDWIFMERVFDDLFDAWKNCADAQVRFETLALLDRIAVEIPDIDRRERFNAEIVCSFLPSWQHYELIRGRMLNTWAVQEQLNFLNENGLADNARCKRLTMDLLELSTRGTRMLALGMLLQGCQIAAKWRLFSGTEVIGALNDLERGFAELTGPQRGIPVVRVEADWLTSWSQAVRAALRRARGKG